MDDNVFQTIEEIEILPPSKEEKKQALKVYSYFGFSMVVFWLFMAVVPSLIFIILSFVAPSLLEYPSTAIIINYGSMYLLGHPILHLLLHQLPDNKAVHPEPARKIKPLQLFGIFGISYYCASILGFFSNWLNDYIGQFVGGGYSADLVNDLSSIPMLPLFIAGVLIAPIMEEKVFRELLFDKVSGYGYTAYVATSGLMFGIFHSNLGQFFYAAALGVIFAKVMYETRNIKYTIALHFMINLLGGVGLGGIVLKQNDEALLQTFGFVVGGLTMVALAIGLFYLIKNRNVKLNHGRKIIGFGRASLAPGMLVYYVIAFGYTILSIFLMADYWSA